MGQLQNGSLLISEGLGRNILLMNTRSFETLDQLPSIAHRLTREACRLALNDDRVCGCAQGWDPCLSVAQFRCLSPTLLSVDSDG